MTDPWKWNDVVGGMTWSLADEALAQREGNAHDHAVENILWLALIGEMARAPEHVTRRLGEEALVALRVGSAGVSVPVDAGGRSVIRWVSVAGTFATAAGTEWARESHPCALALDRGVPILLRHSDRSGQRGPIPSDPIPEMLVAPVRVGEKVVGTVWLMSHTTERSFVRGDLRVLLGLAQVASTALQMNQAAEQSRLDLDRWNDLHRLGEVLSLDGQFHQLLEEILDVALAACRTDFGTIQLMDPATSCLSMAVSRGFPDWCVDRWKLVHGGLVGSGEALARGERVIIEDIAQSPLYHDSPDLEILQGAGVRGVQTTPLFSRSGKPLGVFSTHFRTPCQLDQPTLHLLDLLTWQAADLIERGRGTIEGESKRVGVADPQQVAKGIVEFPEALRVALDSMSESICISDRKGTIVDFNRAFLQSCRFSSREELLRSASKDFDLFEMTLLDGSPVPPASFPVKRALRGETGLDVEYRIRRVDTGESWLARCSFSPILDDAGEVVGTVVVGRDITERKELEAVLLRRTHRLQSVFDTAHDGILMLDVRGAIICANPACLRILDATHEQLCGRSISEFVFHDSRAIADQQVHWQRIAGIGMKAGGVQELYGRRLGGDVFPLELVTSEACLEQQTACFIRDVTERRELQRHVLNVAAEEQKRLGYDLHDGIQQDLTGLSLLATTLCQLLGPSGDRKDAECQPSSVGLTLLGGGSGAMVQDIAERLSMGLEEMQRNLRDLVHGMLPTLADPHGLRIALESLVERTCQLIRCEFACVGDVAVADTEVSFHVYRIAQEAFNNALRHARAKRLSVSMREDGGDLVLKIEDDGVGFDPVAVESGIGLRTMKYRANMIGGSLDVYRNKTGGATVRCVFNGTRIPGFRMS